MSRGKTNGNSRSGATRRNKVASFETIDRSWDELGFSYKKRCFAYKHNETMIYLPPKYPLEARDQVIKFLSQLPDNVQKRIKTILLTDERPNSQIAAVCDHENQELIFFGQVENGSISVGLTPITFFHEAAHLAEDLLANDIPMEQVIAQYKVATDQDYELHKANPQEIDIDNAQLLVGHRKVTKYAAENDHLISEDWAESLALYLNSAHNKVEYDFEKFYPNRAAFIQKYLLS